MAKRKSNTHEVIKPFGKHAVGDQIYFTDKYAQERFENAGYVKALKAKPGANRETKELKDNTETK